MKKDLILKIILSVLLFGVIVISMILTNNNMKDPINVYLFWGNGCPHCEHAKEFFNELDKEYGDYYNLVDYEIWYDEGNKQLYNKVTERLGDTASGVPFIVIGDETFRGYSSLIDQEIIDTILEQYNNKNYVDIVETVK